MKKVYFMRPFGKTGPIKIGCSERVGARRRQLSTARKERLCIIAAVPGSFADEQALHRTLAEHRLEGEWFEPADPVMAVIDYVLENGSLPLIAPDERSQIMRDRYLAGETLQSIGSSYGITRERTRQVLRKMGCASLGYRPSTVSRKPSPLSTSEIELARLYEDGVPPKELRQKFPGLTVSTVLQRAGVKRRPRGFWTARPDNSHIVATVAKLYCQGLTTREIAEVAGLNNQPAIYRYLARAGIKPARKKRSYLRGNDLSAAVSAYMTGETISSIARKTGAAMPTVRKALIGAGVVITREESERRRIAAVVAANHRRHAA